MNIWSLEIHLPYIGLILKSNKIKSSKNVNSYFNNVNEIVCPNIVDICYANFK